MLLLQKLNNMLLRLNFKNLIKIIIIASIPFNISCTNKLEQSNRSFLQRYGSQVDRINRSREIASKDYAKESNKIAKDQAKIWEDPAKIMGIDGTFSTRSAFIDTSKFKLKKKSGEFLPNLETFNKGKFFQSKNPDIFSITYKAENYPKSYKTSSVSFDDIKIPQHDYFGIKSNLEAKQYDIIDHKILQENIDYIHEYLTPDNKEINLILLREKEEIRRRKLMESLMLADENYLEGLREIKADSDSNNTEEENRADITTQNEQVAIDKNRSDSNELLDIQSSF